MLLGTPWSRTISLKNKSVMLVASSVLWHGIKCHLWKHINNYKNWIPTSFWPSKPKTKSIKISTHGSLGTCKGIYEPCGWVLDFAFLQVMHLSLVPRHQHYWKRRPPPNEYLFANEKYKDDVTKTVVLRWVFFQFFREPWREIISPTHTHKKCGEQEVLLIWIV